MFDSLSQAETSSNIFLNKGKSTLPKPMIIYTCPTFPLLKINLLIKQMFEFKADVRTALNRNLKRVIELVLSCAVRKRKNTPVTSAKIYR